MTVKFFVLRSAMRQTLAQILPVRRVLFVLGIVLAATSLRAQTMNLPSTAALHERGPVASLERDLAAIFEDPKFSNAIWAVSIKSLENGEYLFRLNDTKSVLPGSNFKLFTTAEALSLLGPDFRYTTQLVTTGTISNGVLRGDLIIRGAGDPTFGSQLMKDDSDPTAVLEAWADSLKHRGIRRIDGSIVGDDSYFNDAHGESDYYPLGWTVEDLPYYYAMPTAALVFNEDQIGVTVTPGVAKGSAARYEIIPSTDFIPVENYGITKGDSLVIKRKRMPDSVVATGSTSIDISRDLGSNIITIKGEIPQHATAITQQLSVEEPALYTATLLSEILEERGITLNGKVTTSPRGASAISASEKTKFLKAKVLATYTSPPLSEIITVMNKHSDNLFAEELFRTLGKEIGGEGSWMSGTQVMKRYLAGINIDTTKIAIYDGSGLSRMDLITADQMVRLLEAMHKNAKLYESFDTSMPVMGVDGTLASRLKGTSAENNVHAKTGYLTGVRSISGYLRTVNGELIAFSMIANNYTNPVREASNLQDLAILRLVNFSRKEGH
jgi:D-alanyl-D-alanine carboxypeptidase/D-alanyl-D-alanine-endopeptidase (penicillin-binding protein 4)